MILIKLVLAVCLLFAILAALSYGGHVLSRIGHPRRRD